MRFVYFVFLVMVILLSSPCSAATEKSDFRWTIGYEDGLTLRRYLGDNWEIFLGGGPNDSKRENISQSYTISESGSGELTRDVAENDKTEEGFVHLGVGRKVVDADRFVMTGTLSMKYRWRNFQDRDYVESIESERVSIREYVGHKMTTSVYLGLRPSYDVTPRVTLALNFGIYYSHVTQTQDEWDDEFDYPNSSTTTTRTSFSTDSVGTFSAHNLYSMFFIFRF